MPYGGMNNSEVSIEVQKSRGKRIIYVRAKDGLWLKDRVMVNTEVWRHIAKTIGRGSSELEQVFARMERYRQERPVQLPVCDASVSLIKLAKIVEGTPPSRAQRICRAWQCLPSVQRAYGVFTHHDVRAVQVQLLGRFEEPAQVIKSDIPSSVHAFLRAIQCYGFPPFLEGPQFGRSAWSFAQTPLGTTCIAFEQWKGHDLNASAAISSCPVSYQLRADDQEEARTAIDFLVHQLPLIIENDVVLKMARWEPEGHDLLELFSFLEDMKQRIYGVK